MVAGVHSGVSMRRLRPVLTCALLALTVAAGAYAAQPSWEVGLSVGAGPQLTGTFANRFTPSLAGHPEATGDAGQDVRLRGDTGTTLELSLTRMLRRDFGVQMVLAVARAPLGGPSSDYAWALHYTSRQPPDNAPQPLDVSGSSPWPTTRGEMRQAAVAANVLFRYPLYERVSLAFTGGVCAVRLEGEISPLGVTLFSEGGHSTLLSQTYRVGGDLPPTWAGGLDLGTELAWRLSERVTVAFEVRYFAASSVHLDVRVARVLDSPQATRPTTPAELNSLAPLQRVRFDPSFGAALIGIRYRL